MTLVMPLRHGLVTAVGGKGEIEVALLQRSCSLCLPALEESDHRLDLTIYESHECYSACDITVKRVAVLRRGCWRTKFRISHSERQTGRTERMKVGENSGKHGRGQRGLSVLAGTPVESKSE